MFVRETVNSVIGAILKGLLSYLQFRMLVTISIVILSHTTIALQAKAQEASSTAGEDLYVQGLEWMARNNLYRARSLMEQAIALDPNNAGARMDLSLIYCQLGEVAKANEMWAEIEARYSPPASLQKVIQQERLHGCFFASAFP